MLPAPSAAQAAVLDALRGVQMESLTPLQALNLLAELQAKASE